MSDEDTIQDDFHYPAVSPVSPVPPESPVSPVPLSEAVEESQSDVSARRYPVRDRRPPDRFMAGFS